MKIIPSTDRVNRLPGRIPARWLDDLTPATAPCADVRTARPAGSVPRISALWSALSPAPSERAVWRPMLRLPNKERARDVNPLSSANPPFSRCGEAKCIEAAGGKIPVLIDGGFRRGTDILKALALGAAAVGVARPYLWGLASFGQIGVARVIELLRTELALDLGMSGVAIISAIDGELVRIRN